MKKIKHILLAILMVVSFSGGTIALSGVAAADASTDAARQQACLGAGGTWSGGTCTHTGPDLNKIIKAVVNLLSVIVGILAVIMIMVGGFRYVTSGGDSSSLSSAKNTIIYAVIGLVIVALAQVLVHFVLDTLYSKPKPKTAVTLKLDAANSIIKAYNVSKTL